MNSLVNVRKLVAMTLLQPLLLLEESLCLGSVDRANAERIVVINAWVGVFFLRIGIGIAKSKMALGSS